jgi:D-alanine-D-alanine ligase
VEIEEARTFFRDKKILVLYGGWSRERDVSLRSGKKVYDSLLRQGFNVELLDMQRDYLDRIREISPDVVVIMLHGKPGEDGTVQGALETLQIPYTGSGVFASATGMNKLAAKRIFLSASIPTPDFIEIPREADLRKKMEEALEKMGLPLVIKPKDEGSSLGVKILKNSNDLIEIMGEERRVFGDFFMEKYIEGKTVTIGVLGTREKAFALPILELRVKGREFYDYEAKYTKGLTEFVIPAEIPGETYEALQEFSLKVHRLLECRGFSRIDAVVSRDGKPYILEINTIPGMTELSDLPAEAEAHGISYDELVLWILKSAFE